MEMRRDIVDDMKLMCDTIKWHKVVVNGIWYNEMNDCYSKKKLNSNTVKLNSRT
jgi:hypothetical protein